MKEYRYRLIDMYKILRNLKQIVNIGKMEKIEIAVPPTKKQLNWQELSEATSLERWAGRTVAEPGESLLKQLNLRLYQVPSPILQPCGRQL